MNSFYELEYVIDSALLNSKVIRRRTIAGGTKIDLVWYTQLIVDQLKRNNAKPLCKTDGHRKVVVCPIFQVQGPTTLLLFMPN